MDLAAAVVADEQSLEVVEPGEGALDDPALAAQPGAVVAAAPRDHRLDAAPAQLAAVLVVVIAAVSEQPLGTLARPTDLATHRPDTVDERQELGNVVAIAAGQ